MDPEDPTLRASFLLLGSGRTFKRQVLVRGWYAKEAVPLGGMLELCLPTLAFRPSRSEHTAPTRVRAGSRDYTLKISACEAG